MTTKKKILGILLLMAIGVAYFQATTFIVGSFAYPANYSGTKTERVSTSFHIVKH